MTARGATGRSAVDADTLTLAAIQQRDSVHRNYRPIVNPVNGLPMLQLNRNDCEVIDPRACIHHYDSAADLACAIYIHISLPYFYAMVHAGYIANKTRVVLHDTDNSSYVFVLAQNEESTGPAASQTVETLLDTMRNSSGTCRPGVKLVTLDSLIFTQNSSFVRKRSACGADPVAVPQVRALVMSAARWHARLQQAKHLYECQRRLHTDEAVRKLSTACGAGAGKDDLGRVVIPTLVIEAAWGITADRV